MNNAQTTINDFIIEKELGKGTFGSVYLVRRKEDNKIYALKTVKFEKLNKREQENSLNEVRILASVNHPNVIGYKEAFWDDQKKSLNIVMEYADDGDLASKINYMKKENMFFNEKIIWAYAIQMIRGLKALHDKKIMHRDIKSANIFLIKDKHQCKIGDMNVSKVIKEKVLKTQTGTPYYASPEVWKDEPYSYKSDLWSIGCVIYELCTLKPPFKGKNIDDLYRNVIKGKFEKINNNYSEDLWKMILMLLQVDVNKRCDCEEFLNSKLIMNKMLELRNNNFDLDFRILKKNKSNMDGFLLKTIKFRDIKDIKAQLPQKKNYESTKKVINTKNYFQNNRLDINGNINNIISNNIISNNIISNNFNHNENKIINTITNNKYFIVDLSHKNNRDSGSLCNNNSNSNLSKKNNSRRPVSGKIDPVGLDLDNLFINNYNNYHKNNSNKNEKTTEDSNIKKIKDRIEKNNILKRERQKEKDRSNQYNQKIKEEKELKEKQILKLLNNKKTKNVRYRSQIKENSKRLLRNQSSSRYLDYQKCNNNIVKNNISKNKEDQKQSTPYNKHKNISSIIERNVSKQRLTTNDNAKIKNNNRNIKLFKCNSSINYMESLNKNNLIINKNKNKKNNTINKNNKNVLKRDASVKIKINENYSVSPKKNLNLRINQQSYGTNNEKVSALYYDKKNYNKKKYRNKAIAEINLNKYNSNNISKNNNPLKNKNISSLSSSKNTSRPKRKVNTNIITNSNNNIKKVNNNKEKLNKNINNKYNYELEYDFYAYDQKKQEKKENKENKENNHVSQKRKNNNYKTDTTEPELLMMINPIKVKEPHSNFPKKPLNVSITSVNNSLKNMNMDNNLSENNKINRQKSFMKYIGQINVNDINNNIGRNKKNFVENIDINNIIGEGNEKRFNQQNKNDKPMICNNFYNINTVNNPVDKPVKLINIINYKI